jgi:hypothetical protein
MVSHANNRVRQKISGRGRAGHRPGRNPAVLVQAITGITPDAQRELGKRSASAPGWPPARSGRAAARSSTAPAGPAGAGYAGCPAIVAAVSTGFASDW